MSSIIEQRNWRQALRWELDRYNWDYFGTGTFPDTLTETEARKRVEHYFRELEKRLQSPLPRFWVLEPHQHRETPHLHFLLAESKQIDEDVEELLWKYWRKVSSQGRFQSREYDSSRGGVGYMVKYLTKSISDWDVANLDKMGVLHVSNSLLGRKELDEMMRKELAKL